MRSWIAQLSRSLLQEGQDCPLSQARLPAPRYRGERDWLPSSRRPTSARRRGDASQKPETGAPAPPRILVIGDVMTDVIVRPEGPLARGSDRRASITFQPGGSGGQPGGVARLVWGRRRFRRPRRRGRRRARDGAPQECGRDALARRRRYARDWTVDCADRCRRRTQLPRRPGRRRFSRGHRRPRPSDCGSSAHPSLRLLVLCSFAARGGSRRDPARGKKAGQRRSRVGRIPARGRSAELSQLDAGGGDPVPQRRGSGNSRRLGRSRSPVRAARGAFPARRRRARRGWLRSGEAARRWRVAAPKVEAIDTIGAGDAFVAAFLASRLEGADVQMALERAVEAGAVASTRVGGRPGR